MARSRGRRPDVFETSGTTGYYIMATGREFLPVGGFSGRVPAPSLAAFKRLVAQGRIVRVTVATRPLTRTPDLRWVVAHCTRTPLSQYDNVAQVTRTVFECDTSPTSRADRSRVLGSQAAQLLPVTPPLPEFRCCRCCRCCRSSPAWAAGRRVVRPGQ